MTSPRTYRSLKRTERARQTRLAVLSAAGELFACRGYAGTTMRLVAESTGVSVPMVEQLFGTKSNLLKSCIDVAIAGDDEPVAMLEREWTLRAKAATDLHGLVDVAATVLGPAQARSAPLVLVAFEGGRSDPELAELAHRLADQRAVMATWLVGQLEQRRPLRTGLAARDAVDTVWVLLDPAVHERITRRRGKSLAYYERWIADSIIRLLFDDEQPRSNEKRQR